jgi:hypothetical protein
MCATYEQAYTILKTLNIDLQGFNDYLANILNANAIKKEVKDDIKKEAKKEVKQENTNKLFAILSTKTGRWGDCDDETASSMSDTLSSTSETVSSSSDGVSIPSTMDTNSKTLNYLSVVSSMKEDSEGFEQHVSKKTQKKNATLSVSNHPMFKDYGLADDQTVYDRKDMATAFSEKWTLGTDYQIHPNAFCPSMMEGNICKEYCTYAHLNRCKYVHLHRCKYETDGKVCTNSSCTFLHARDMRTKEAKANFQRTMHKI